MSVSTLTDPHNDLGTVYLTDANITNIVTTDISPSSLTMTGNPSVISSTNTLDISCDASMFISSNGPNIINSTQSNVSITGFNALTLSSTNNNVSVSSPQSLIVNTAQVVYPGYAAGVYQVASPSGIWSLFGSIEQSSYTPLVTNQVNIASIVINTAFYTRLADTVSVWISGSITTTNTVATSFRLSLPVAPTNVFTTQYQLMGMGNRLYFPDSDLLYSNSAIGDTTAFVQFTSGSNPSHDYFITFTYKIQ